ncbi:MAG: hypothetical protein ACK4S0_03215, partial [Sediminibacterium sp.]
MSRLSIKIDVLRRLFAYSANQCAFPDCTEELVTNDGIYVGEICHIEAASEGGPRYNEFQSDEDRRKFENLVLLCHKHHRISDKYDIEWMRKIKYDHESKQKQDFEISDELIESILYEINQKLDVIIRKQDQQQLLLEKGVGNTDEILSLVKNIHQSTNLNPGIADISIYAKQLDFIKDLKKRGLYQAALNLLFDYHKTNWNQLTPELKFKTNANIAVLYLNMTNREDAIKWLESLFDIPYEHGDRYAYLGLGYGLKNDSKGFQFAYDKAIQLGSENSNLWLGYIFLHEETKSAEAIEKAIPEAQLKKPEVALNLANVFYRNGDAGRGNEYLEAIIRIEKEPLLLAEIKATLATRALPNLVNQFKVLRNQYSKKEIAEIELAHRYLSESWDTIKDKEIANYRTYILLNRGVLNRILKRNDEADDDFYTVYKLTKNYLAFKNLVLNLIIEKQYEKALNLIKQHQNSGVRINEEERVEMIHMEARILMLENDIDESIAKLESLLSDDNPEQNKNILLSISNVLSYKGMELELNELLSRLIQTYPDDLEVILGYIQAKIEFPPSEECIQLINKAESIIDNGTDHLLIHFLANIFMNIREYLKALKYLKELGDNSILNDVTRDIISCYFKVDDLNKVIEIATPLHKESPGDFFLTSKLMECYTRISKPELAIEVALIFLEQSKSNRNENVRYNLALLYYREKKYLDVINVIQQIVSYDTFTIAQKFQIAYWYGTLGEKEKGLELAFQFRSNHYDDVIAHNHYIQVLSVITTSPDQSFPEIVDVTNGIHLEDENGRIDYYLISDISVKGENVISTDHNLAKSLLGKSKGDIIYFDKGYGIFKKYTIKMILNKYAYAYQETIRFYETRFSGMGGMVVMKVGSDNPFSELEVLLRNRSRERSEFESDAFAKHLSKELPLSTIVNLSGDGFVKTLIRWRSLVSFYQVAFVGNNRLIINEA